MTGTATDFARLVRAEWTKLRTVRGWVVGLLVAVVVTVAVGLLATAGSAGSSSGCGDPNEDAACAAPRGPDGAAVSDSFYFVHQALEGDGSITARVAPLTGQVMPWSKAGLLLKESTAQGSPYAAVMVTGGHGVRMQHDFTHDTPGSARSAEAPTWLRLTRTGDTITGEESADGRRWTPVAAVRLADLPATVHVGLFVTSPPDTVTDQELFGLSASGEPTRATAVFDDVDLQGTPAAETTSETWSSEQIGGDPVLADLGGVERSGTTMTISGSGDIAPAVGGQALGTSRAVEQSLVGTFAGLIAVIVVATMFVTAGEYGKGMVRSTLAAVPQREQVLAAKALVVGTVAFGLGLVAAGAAISLGQSLARANHEELRPVDGITELRVVLGTAALLAATAILALAVGTLLRRSAAAVTTVLAAVVLPYILATASVLPEAPSEWLLRLTPAAAFSVQQTLVEYPQVDNLYAPVNGYFPLPPWGGFAVLGAYAAVALSLAAFVLERRDA